MIVSSFHKMRIKHLSNYFRMCHYPSIYHVETDYLSSPANLCYLVYQSVKLIVRQIPFLRGLRFLSHGTQDYVISPHGTLVPEIPSQQFIENMNCKKIIPSPKKRMRISFNDNFKEISFPVQNDAVFSKQQKGSVDYSNKSKMNELDTQPSTSKNASIRPNYFVAVQISDPQVHKRIKDIQQHISIQDSRFSDCMNSVATLHITLMVMNISDLETHERAKKALTNVYKEYNKVICENPLVLEFCGLGTFRDKVLFAKIKENESHARLLQLADSVHKHFAEFEIFSTDKRSFNPHLTIAKINFSNRKQRALKKINPLLYNELVDNHLGSANIQSIQLLRMDGPKDSMGYYTGDELLFRLPLDSCTSNQIMPDISEKKKQIREKIAEATKKAFKRTFNNQRTSDVQKS